jgi:PmbA protein
MPGSLFALLQFCLIPCVAVPMSNEVDTRQLPELERIVATALEEARRQGATQAEASVGLQQGLTVTVRLGEVDTIEYHRDRGLAVTVYVGQRKGSASTADLRPEAVVESVGKACSIARYTAEDPCSGLADPERLAREFPDLDIDHPWAIDADEAVERARECETAGRNVDARINNSEGATLSTHRSLRVYGNTHGFLAGFPSTSHSLSCSLVAESDGQMQRDYWHTVARCAADLEAGAAVGRRAAERTLARLGARRLDTRRLPVLFVPEIARSLYGHFLGAVRGASQYRHSSFLMGAAGEQVFPAFLQMSERPHLPRALASSPFDLEGVATRDRELVHDGVLDGYICGSYSARRLGIATTGNAGGIHNLLVRAPSIERSHAELLRAMGTGLLVTELMGQGVNPVTGDYSRGASGFLVENGTPAYPVHEITIAGNLRDIYRQIVGIGNDIDALGSVRCGSLLIEGMTVAGT